MPEKILVLALGSNLGDRQTYLSFAQTKLAETLGKILALSPIYETEPYGVSHTEKYLNQVLVLKTTFEADLILETTQQIEKQAGRLQKGDLSPRNLDIDILYLGHLFVKQSNLEIPHPRIQERRFVTQPLSDVLPFWKFPDDL
jgi:2-amino-4-hydroxy-6-hydroxymethyldihydropteridine diphosphokinase